MAIGDQACSNCMYFEVIYKDGLPGNTGDCRRRAPTIAIFGEKIDGVATYLQRNSEWPQVYTFNWCGEYHERSSE